jgi:hypothetical protein
LVVYADQRDEYLAALEAADHGVYPPFSQFVTLRGLDAAEYVGESLAAARSPRPDESVELLRRFLTARAGLSHGEIEEIAKGIRSYVAGIAVETANALPLPGGTMMQVSEVVGRPASPQIEGYRGTSTNEPQTAIAFTTSSPVPVTTDIGIEVQIARDPGNPYAFLLVEARARHGHRVRLDEVHPVRSAAFEQRVDVIVRRWLGEAIHRLVVEAEKSFGPLG